MKSYLSFCTALLFTLLWSGTTCPAQNPVIRIGDSVDIRLSGFHYEDAGAVSSNQVVDDDGMVNLAYIDKVKIVGMDCSAAQRLIENRYKEAKIFTNPTITVTVTAQRFVNITGEIKGGGRVAYLPDMTLMTGIAAAGGFTDFADKKRVKFVREGRVVVIDTTKISKDPSKDVRVLPGDQIYVPQSTFF